VSFWNRRSDASIEREVRRHRPEARNEFVAMLAGRLTGDRRPSRSRLVAAFAATTLLVVALVALGGISYAAGGAKSAADTLTSALSVSSNSTSPASSPASDQYGIGACVLGYPDHSHDPRSSVVFNESEVLRGFSIVGTGANPGVAAWYSDEHALLLGIEPPNVTDMTEPPAIQDAATKTARVHNPQIGNTASTDSKGRPLYPAAFVTKITPPNQTGRQGDWQQQNDNSNADPPQDLFGTWKHATQATDIGSMNDPPANNSFGPGADTPPTGLKYEKFRTEVRWDLFSLTDQNGQPITAHNAYRVQFMVHDGDQNKDGGDVGQACVNITIP
jgi:hypothetical protein